MGEGLGYWYTGMKMISKHFVARVCWNVWLECLAVDTTESQVSKELQLAPNHHWCVS
jgi:hypothetical protein